MSAPSDPSAPPFGSRGDEQAQRRRLFRNRGLATGMLAVMAGVFGATYAVPEPGFATLLIRAGAEAGIVGGLADWFAVTALFRRPLGLPIPHTAIVPNNKERIGRTLGRFVERHFLTEDVLLAKLRQADPGRRLGGWLVKPETPPFVATAVLHAMPELIRALENPTLHDFAHRTLGEQLRKADLAPLIGRAVQLVTTSGEADVLFERAVAAVERWIGEREPTIDALVRERSRWWVPKAVDQHISGALVAGIIDVLHRLKQPDSEARQGFRDALTALIEDLLRSPEQRALINASKDRILNHPDVQAWLASMWHEMSRTALADLEKPDSRLRAALEELIALTGHVLATDAELRRQFDQLLGRLAGYLLSWRGAIGSFITEVVKSWDTRTISDRLELVVGTDLQYIRMNGTIVGALAGCGLFLLTRLFGQF